MTQAQMDRYTDRLRAKVAPLPELALAGMMQRAPFLFPLTIPDEIQRAIAKHMSASVPRGMRPKPMIAPKSTRTGWGAKMTEIERQRILAMHASGMHSEAIGRDVGRTGKCVIGFLRNLGMTPNRYDPAPRQIKPVVIDGRTWPSLKALGEYVGVSETSIRKWLSINPDRLRAVIEGADARAAA